MFRFRGRPILTKIQLILLFACWGWAFTKAMSRPDLLALYLGGMMLGAHLGLAAVHALYIYSRFIPVIRHYGVWIAGLIVTWLVREIFILSGQAFWLNTGQEWLIALVMLGTLSLLLASANAQWAAIQRRHQIFG